MAQCHRVPPAGEGVGQRPLHVGGPTPSLAALGTMNERNAIRHLNSWAGRSRHRVTVIGETTKHYRIRWEDTPALPRWQTGQIYLVPKYAITVKEQG